MTRLLYDQYRTEKENANKPQETDMIKRLEAYRRDINLFNTLTVLGVSNRPKTTSRPTPTQ